MTGKRIRKMNIPPKQKMEHTYCVSRKKYTGNSYIGPKRTDNKVRLLKTKCLKCKHDK